MGWILGIVARGVLREAGGDCPHPSDAISWVCVCLCAVFANFHHLSQSMVILTVLRSPIRTDVRVRWTRVQTHSAWSPADSLEPLSPSFFSSAWD